MMSKSLLLFFIPAIYCHIAIKIRAGQSETDTSIDFDGEAVDIISDADRKAFNIEDRSLKDACEAFSGKRPTDVFVKRPTPWEDVYRKFNWEEGQRVLIPVQSRILGINTKPVIVSTREFENYSHVNATYNAAISHQIKETVSNVFSKNKELEVCRDVSYKVDFVAGSIGGKTSLAYKAMWGNSTKKSRAVTLGSTSSVEIELPPGKAVVATLTATHGTLDLEVDYEAYLIGRVFANYHYKYKNHNWWSYPIPFVMRAANIPEKIKTTEKISIGYFTSARIEVKNKETSVNVRVAPAGIISGGHFR